jgi:hypothetical protein
LTGTCPQCGVEPITYMGLTFHGDTDRLGGISFYCDDCDYLGGSPIGYHPASYPRNQPHRNRLPDPTVGAGNDCDF